MASAGDAAGASCGVGLEFPPLAMFDQVGEGVQGGGEFNCCDPARWLDQPTAPKGEAGGQSWGDVT
jgi:hypothetical protein